MSGLADLVAEYDRPRETGRGELLEAMAASGGAREATAMAGSADPGDRYVAARLMHLLPGGPGYLEPLGRLVLDADPGVAAAARRALRTQPRTPEWRAAVRALAQAPDGGLRAAAAEWLDEA